MKVSFKPKPKAVTPPFEFKQGKVYGLKESPRDPSLLYLCTNDGKLVNLTEGIICLSHGRHGLVDKWEEVNVEVFVYR